VPEPGQPERVCPQNGLAVVELAERRAHHIENGFSRLRVRAGLDQPVNHSALSGQVPLGLGDALVYFLDFRRNACHAASHAFATKLAPFHETEPALAGYMTSSLGSSGL
jgi:hypothetical protein